MKQLTFLFFLLSFSFLYSQDFRTLKDSDKLGLYLKLNASSRDSLFESVSVIFDNFQDMELLEALSNQRLVYQAYIYPKIKLDGIFDKNHAVQFKIVVIFRQDYFYIIMTDFIHIDYLPNKYPDAGGALENIAPKGGKQVLSMVDWHTVKKDTFGYCKEMRTAMILKLIDDGYQIQILEMNH